MVHFTPLFFFFVDRPYAFFFKNIVKHEIKNVSSCTLCSILNIIFFTYMYPADDGAAMEAEVANIPALWRQHAGVRQCTEMARTLR